MKKVNTVFLLVYIKILRLLFCSYFHSKISSWFSSFFVLSQFGSNFEKMIQFYHFR